MKVTFELGPSDIRYFRERLKEVRAKGTARDEMAVIGSASRLAKEALAAEPPAFVVERIEKLDQLIEMLRDQDWRLEGRDRARILDALAYFVEEDDVIPDKVPGIGYLDDAIMIELVVRELKHEIEAYEDFCEYRRRLPKTEADSKLDERRKALQARMRRRRRRERAVRRTSTGSRPSGLGLW
ncbi:MAG: YkvA family protein [Myxococcota bacterium]